MVSLLNVSLIGFLLLAVVIAQAKPLLETSNNTYENKSPVGTQQQLYELYKTMRADPRLVSVSNNDIVSYIYQNFVIGNGDDIDSGKNKYRKHRRNRHQQATTAE
jgi:hypothetical protein